MGAISEPHAGTTFWEKINIVGDRLIDGIEGGTAMYLNLSNTLLTRFQDAIF